MREFRSEFIIKFNDVENYKQAVKALGLLGDIQLKIEELKCEYNSLNEDLIKFFKGVPFDKYIYDNLDVEARREIGRKLSEKYRVSDNIRLLNGLLR